MQIRKENGITIPSFVVMGPLTGLYYGGLSPTGRDTWTPVLDEAEVVEISDLDELLRLLFHNHRDLRIRRIDS